MRARVGLSVLATMAAVVLLPSTTAAHAATPAAVDTSSRSSVMQSYENVLAPALAVPLGWTGSVSGCNAGAPSSAAQDATLTALNWIRQLAGLAPVTFDATLSSKAQQAALMMQANNALSHDPPSTWACWTQAGHDAAGASNLFLGVTGAAAMTGYMVDPGSGNYFAGHRRWILYPPQEVMGSGSTSNANALYIFGGQDSSQTGPDWVSWPTPGYFPGQLEPGGRWSLSGQPGTDFSNAAVTVSQGGTAIPVTVDKVETGYGDPTLVWELNPGYQLGHADKQYDVNVTGIVQGNQTVSHAYSVTLFDATIDPEQTISFTQPDSATYGATGHVLKATASSGLPVSFSSQSPTVCTTSGTAVSFVGVGSCVIAANQSGDDTHNPAPTITKSFDVSPAQLTFTADDASRVKGADNPAFTATAAGFVNGETLATSDVQGEADCSTEADASSGRGTYAITCAQGTLTSTHYAFAFQPGTLSIAGVPGAPTIGGVTTGSGRATVAFSPPTDDGGSPVTSYTVTASPGGLIATGAGSPLTVDGLTNGTSYTFSVAASNAAGTGSPSGDSAAVAPSSGVQPTLTLDASTLNVGRSAVVTVRGSPGDAVTLLAYSRPSTTYAVVRQGTLDSDGVAIFSVAPRTNTRLFARTSSGDSTSAVISVRPAESLHATTSGRTVEFSGQLVPGRGGVTVKVFTVLRGQTTYLGSATTDANGAWSYARAFATAGPFTFISQTLSDLTNLAGQSNRVSVRLR